MTGLPSYRRPALWAGAILLITFLAYLPSLQNDLLKTWDDQAYVTNNQLIRNLSLESFVRIFREDGGRQANYHPLTTVSLAVNYAIAKTAPFGYHLTNLLLHLLNTLLVLVMVLLLPATSLPIAAMVALLFGIHPLHVESVAWISERKDVLYTLFFLATMIAYQIHLRRGSGGATWYLLALGLFACALLAKAMAAALPLVLLALDYCYSRKWTIGTLLEKVPFFLLATGFGILALLVQTANDATRSDLFSLGNRLLHACYGVSTYIGKILLPLGLSAFYPYPYPLMRGAWILDQPPPIFFLTLLFTLAWGLGLACLIRRAAPDQRLLVFGMLFYTATILLVVQFIPVGRAIIADRYTYVASIGIFLCIACLVERLWQRIRYRTALLTGLGIYALVLAAMTYKRCSVWTNDATLWTDVMVQYPDDNRILPAINNRANYYELENRLPEALQDYLRVAEINPDDDVVLETIGRIYGKELHDLDAAVQYFTRAVAVNPRNLPALSGLATVYGLKGEHRRALQYALAGLQIDGKNPALRHNLAVICQHLDEPDRNAAFCRR
jgi:tetratricopeptide (TPR) repeat protein